MPCWTMMEETHESGKSPTDDLLVGTDLTVHGASLDVVDESDGAAKSRAVS